MDIINLVFLLCGLIVGFFFGFIFFRYTFSNTTEIESKDYLEDTISTKDIYDATQKALESSLDLRSDIKAIFDSYQNPIQQGQQGEDLLKLIFENSGLIEGEQFIYNEALPNNAGRPDFVIKIPGGGVCYVDAKFLTNNFIEAHKEENISRKEELFELNAESVEFTARDLARRNYADFEGYQSPNFVFMFLPSDNIYADAVNRRKDLLLKCYNGFAATGNAGTPIILTTPSSIGAALKVVSMMWKERNLYENVASIKGSLKKMHAGLNKFNKDFIDGGAALIKASHRFRLAFKQYSKIKPHVKEIEETIDREMIGFIDEQDFMNNSRETELSENDIGEK